MGANVRDPLATPPPYLPPSHAMSEPDTVHSQREIAKLHYVSVGMGRGEVRWGEVRWGR